MKKNTKKEHRQYYIYDNMSFDVLSEVVLKRLLFPCSIIGVVKKYEFPVTSVLRIYKTPEGEKLNLFICFSAIDFEMEFDTGAKGNNTTYNYFLNGGRSKDLDDRILSDFNALINEIAEKPQILESDQLRVYDAGNGTREVELNTMLPTDFIEGCISDLEDYIKYNPKVHIVRQIEYRIGIGPGEYQY